VVRPLPGHAPGQKTLRGHLLSTWFSTQYLRYLFYLLLDGSRGTSLAQRRGELYTAAGDRGALLGEFAHRLDEHSFSAVSL